MTLQQSRARAFSSQLRLRGKTFQTDANPPATFAAIVSFAPQVLDDFTLAEAQRTEGAVYVLRNSANPLSALPPEDFYSLGIVERTLLTNQADNREQWRVARIEDNPVNVCVILHCNQEPV